MDGSPKSDASGSQGPTNLGMFGCFERVEQKNNKVEVEEKIFIKKDQNAGINVISETEYNNELLEESKTVEIEKDINMFKVITKDERSNIQDWIA